MIKEQYKPGVTEGWRVQVENGISVINIEQLLQRSLGAFRGEMLEETVTWKEIR